MNAHAKKRGSQDELLEKQRARERWRYVRPKVAGKVLSHHRYWTRQFVTFYRDRCEEIARESPGDAYLLCQHLAEVTRRVRVGEEAGYFPTVADKMSAMVRALSVQAICCCAHGEMEEAQLSFERAFGGLDKRQVSPKAKAELHLKHAQFLELLGDLTKAADEISRCFEICEKAGLRAITAEARVVHAGLNRRFGSGNPLVEALEAARLARRRTDRGKRTCHVALNLAIQQARESRLGLKKQEAGLLVLNAFKEQMKGTPTSSRKLKALWIEGRLLGNLRIERHAVRQVTKARKGLRSLEKIREYAVCSLDLAAMHVQFGEEAEAHAVLVDTHSELVQRGFDAEGWPPEATRDEIQRALDVFDSMLRAFIVPSSARSLG